MRVKIDPELCIACGACISLAPSVYDWGDDGKAKVIADPVPEDQEQDARDALESCPTEAIKEI
jgi:ferredoxin